MVAELGLVGVLTIGGMILCCFKDLKYVRKKLVPAELKQKHGQTVRLGDDIRVYLARATEGSLIWFIVSSVFIPTLWYPS